MTSANGRTANHPISPMFLERWSPRAFTGAEIGEAELATIFEAARWAPSSYNSQPWRFLYARRNTPQWDRFLGLLIEFNQSWAKNAAALIIMVSKETMASSSGGEHPSHSHSFDAGAAWAQMGLQAVLSGWYAHGMVGFDMPRAAQELNVPAGFRVEAAIAIGKKAGAATLPEALAAREFPSDRKPLVELALEGGFPAA